MRILKIFLSTPPPFSKEKYYIFIDEIQYLKNPSNFLKLLYDEFRDKVKLVVTGSSAFYIDEKFTDSLAGRKKIFNVRPLNFYEYVNYKSGNKITIRFDEQIRKRIGGLGNLKITPGELSQPKVIHPI